MNIRQCKLCEKMVDFDEPWCDHETMEESAWLNMPKSRSAKLPEAVYDSEVEKAAKELGHKAGELFIEQCRKAFG